MTALSHPESTLPPIPNKRYFTIGEVGSLCDVKSHVLRYWEQEFTQLKPTKRRGNRRYYQRHDIELIRLIRRLLYEQGFTIAGARQQLVQNAKPPSGKSDHYQEHDLLSEPGAIAHTSDDTFVSTEPMQTNLARGDQPDGLTHLFSINPDSDVSPMTQIRLALEQISQDIEDHL